jgi:PLP dependent protein
VFHDLVVLRDFLAIGEQIMSHSEGLSHPSEMEFLGDPKSGARTHHTSKAGGAKFGKTGNSSRGSFRNAHCLPAVCGRPRVTFRRTSRMFRNGQNSLELESMNVAENLERVWEQIASAAAKSGRSADDVELVAITKTHPAEKVREAIEAGQTLFGESRVQEARAKIPELPSTLRWHFVGHLQKNKVRQALPLFEMIQSVDSLALAQDINRIAEEEGLHPRVLLEVNVAGEGTKFGFAPDKLRQQMEELLALPRLSIEGLMCIPPLADESESSRKCFVQVRELRDSLANEFDVKLPQLSMGMTNDFPIAVEEGATLVRVGTAIFGERSKANREL